SYAEYPVIIIVYTAEVIGGRLAAGDETLEACCYPSASIPWPELAFPSTVEALRDFLQTPVKG
ncbi:MAG: NUDIX hydrolase, partial [Nitrospirota bacterium]